MIKFNGKIKNYGFLKITGTVSDASASWNTNPITQSSQITEQDFDNSSNVLYQILHVKMPVTDYSTTWADSSLTSNITELELENASNALYQILHVKMPVTDYSTTWAANDAVITERELDVAISALYQSLHVTMPSNLYW